MWGLLAPCSTLYAQSNFYVCSKLAKFQHRISMHHAVMRICISHRLSMCAQNGVLRDFESEYVKILCSDP